MSIKKLVIGLAVVALVFGVAVTNTKAATIEELQAQIAQLTALIAQLQGGSTGTPAAFTYTRVLPVGSSGADVSALQNFLISKGFSIPAGATGYFGPQTTAALALYQASVGIAPAYGNFGPITMAHMNSLVGTTGGTSGGTTDTTPSALEGGAGDISVTEKNSGASDQVFEGEEEAKILGMDVEADGSDIAINSVKVRFTVPSSGSTRLNRYIDSVDIMMGDEVVGSVDVDEFTKDGSYYTRNIPVTDAIIRDGDTERIFVAVNANGDIDTSNLSNAWTVEVTSIRFEDATGALFSDSVSTVSESFTFESLSTAGDITLTVSEDDASVNNSHTVAVSSSSDTNDVELLSFKLKAKDSDITIDTILFSLAGSGAGVTEMINDARLLMDGEEVGDVSIDAGSDNSLTTFASSTDTSRAITISNLDDDDVVIPDGDTVTFTLVGDVNDTGGAFGNGDSLTVSLDADNITAEDDNGDTLGNTPKKGTAASDGTMFASTGIMLDDFVTIGDPLEIDHIDTTPTDNEGKYIMTFTVKAFEDTAFLTLTAASSTAAEATDGLSFSMETNADVAAQTGTTTASLERVSGGSITSNGRLQIDDGELATLRLTVWHDPGTQGTLRVQVNELNYMTTDTGGDGSLVQVATPAADFQSSTLLIHQ